LKYVENAFNSEFQDFYTVVAEPGGTPRKSLDLDSKMPVKIIYR